MSTEGFKKKKVLNFVSLFYCVSPSLHINCTVKLQECVSQDVLDPQQVKGFSYQTFYGLDSVSFPNAKGKICQTVNENLPLCTTSSNSLIMLCFTEKVIIEGSRPE